MLPRQRLEKILARVDEIESLMSQPETARDSARTQALSKELAELTAIARPFREYQRVEKDLTEIQKFLDDSKTDAELQRLYKEEKGTLTGKRDELEREIEDCLLQGSDPDAARNAIVEIRAGTGGEEAALFASDLFRMFSRYAQSCGLVVEIMDSNPTGKGGFKEIIFEITGPAAFRKFRFESGIHRVQRVPETEASGRIHTSAVTVAVLPEAEEVDVQIQPTEIKIETFRASGHGGQHVNKTDSAVRITHLPTGITASCQDEKSQYKNKAQAMKILRTRLLEKKREAYNTEVRNARRSQIGSGDRSGKIRTYNFHERRVTDHRIGLTLHNLDDILNGRLGDFFQALEREEKAQRLSGETAENNGN